MEKFVDNFKNYSWFDGVGTDKYGRNIVYVKSMSQEVFNSVPTMLGGKQVLIHYSSSRDVNIKNYKSNLYDELEVNIKKLCAEFDLDLVEDIFWELKEGNMSITNVKDQHPILTSSLQKIYDTEDFDKIMEIIDKLYDKYHIDL